MTRRATLALGPLLIAGCAGAPDPGASDGSPPASGREQLRVALEPDRPRAALGGLLSTGLSSLRYTLMDAEKRQRIEIGTEDISLELADGTRVG